MKIYVVNTIENTLSKSIRTNCFVCLNKEFAELFFDKLTEVYKNKTKQPKYFKKGGWTNIVLGWKEFYLSNHEDKDLDFYIPYKNVLDSYTTKEVYL